MVMSRTISKPLVPGDKIGNLELLAIVGRRIHGAVVGEWRCYCGESFVADTRNVRYGNTSSCGCHLAKTRRENNLKHGESKSPEFRIWAHIHSRCNYIHDAAYKNYGGRGIGISEDWYEFKNFLRDMGRRPQGGYQIDRIDNDGGYSKENCRWVTSEVNCNNRRNTRVALHDGELIPVSLLAKEHGLHPQVLRGRLDNGWEVEVALTAPIAKNGSWSTKRSDKQKTWSYAYPQGANDIYPLTSQSESYEPQ